jgi:hypothetical protein
MANSNSISYESVNTLLFDPKNPRLPSSVDENSDEAIIRWMLEDATIIELMMSIGEKGYFPGEALLVVEDKNVPGKYIVIEGNRRLTAVKLLLDPALAPIRKKSVEQASQEAKYKPQQLPVLKFDKREDIIYYLGYRHITGIKTWGALAKAKYLKQLLESLGPGDQTQQYQNLAKTIGSRADYVAKQLAGLAVYEKIGDEGFFNIKDLDQDRIDFAVLTTALNYQNIHKFIGMKNSQDRELENINTKSLKELTSWMFERLSEGKTRLGESRNLGDLNSVLGNEKALTAFRDGRPLPEAVLLTEKPSELFQKSVLEAKSRLDMAQSNVHLVNEFTQAQSQLLFEIMKIARNLRAIVEDKLLDTDSRSE